MHNSSIWFSYRFVFCLSSGPWPPRQCQAWVLSHGMALKSSQRVVGYSHICVSLSRVFCRTVSSVDLGFVTRLTVTFSGSMQSTDKHWSVRVKTRVRHQCNFSMFSELVGFAFSSRPYHQFGWRSTNGLGNSMSCSGFPWGPKQQLNEM